MTTALETPGADVVPVVVAALRDWQHEGGPLQLHPGDVGWRWRYGAATATAALRTWRCGGDLAAVGMLDGSTLLRLAVAPEAIHDVDLARVVAADIVDPDRGVLPAGRAAVEARCWVALKDQLADVGWQPGESWTPLHRDLADGIEEPATVRVETVTGEQAADRTAVHRASFDSGAFTVPRWHAMASGPLYSDARCLVAYANADDDDTAVAAITVWSAGAGRPGLIEPMGVHPEHRGRGYGRAITLAGVAALRALGASSATVCTPSTNAAAVAAYEAAGFNRRPQARDRTRP